MIEHEKSLEVINYSSIVPLSIRTRSIISQTIEIVEFGGQEISTRMCRSVNSFSLSPRPVGRLVFPLIEGFYR